MNRILVTGANGFVARHLRPVLSRHGFGMVSVSRQRITPLPGETILTVSGYDDPEILDAARGCVAAIHLVGSGRQTVHERYDDANYSPAVAVARVCKVAGVPRMVYMSGLGVSADAVTGYFISKYMAEQAIIGSVPEPVIFRPSYIIGKDDHLTTNFRRQGQAGTITVPGSGNYAMQPVSVYDAVKVLEMAATRKIFAGHTLDLVGPQTITFTEYAKAFAGSGVRVIHTSLEDVYKDAILNRVPVYHIDDLNIMVGGYVGDHNTLRGMTGMQFRMVSDMLYADGFA